MLTSTVRYFVEEVFVLLVLIVITMNERLCTFTLLKINLALSKPLYTFQTGYVVKQEVLTFVNHIGLFPLKGGRTWLI